MTDPRSRSSRPDSNLTWRALFRRAALIVRAQRWTSRRRRVQAEADRWRRLAGSSSSYLHALYCFYRAGDLPLKDARDMARRRIQTDGPWRHLIGYDTPPRYCWLCDLAAYAHERCENCGAPWYDPTQQTWTRFRARLAATLTLNWMNGDETRRAATDHEVTCQHSHAHIHLTGKAHVHVHDVQGHHIEEFAAPNPPAQLDASGVSYGMTSVEMMEAFRTIAGAGLRVSDILDSFRDDSQRSDGPPLGPDVIVER